MSDSKKTYFPDYPIATDLKISRFDTNPIIRPEMLDGADGENINGPTLIKVPDWIENPLGKYYLYFAHHGGSYIRMAYADDLRGEWTIYKGGVLSMDDLEKDFHHIASPDIIIDEENRKIRMYFHGYVDAQPDQQTFIALSDDGLDFTADENQIGLSYFRVFSYKDKWYSILHSGRFYTSDDGFEFTPAQRLFGPNPHRPRHVGLDIDGDCLWVYHSNFANKPERILRSRIDLSQPVENWHAVDTCEVLRPETDYEGANLPLVESKGGYTDGEHALRDPYIFNDSDGRKYLLYSVAGESGIAIAEIENFVNMRDNTPETQNKKSNLLTKNLLSLIWMAVFSLAAGYLLGKSGGMFLLFLGPLHWIVRLNIIPYTWLFNPILEIVICFVSCDYFVTERKLEGMAAMGPVYAFLGLCIIWLGSIIVAITRFYYMRNLNKSSEEYKTTTEA